MAISTYKVFLMKKADTGEQWSKLIDIKEFPDLGGEPEMLETTTLSDNMQTYIEGLDTGDVGLHLVRQGSGFQHLRIAAQIRELLDVNELFVGVAGASLFHEENFIRAYGHV